MPQHGEILSPLQVWEGYDPSAEPLEVELLKMWTEDGNCFKEMYFTGKTTGAEKTRIYAVYSAPEEGELLPGILHVHGGGQTANLDILRYWNDRGYAALSFNWGGRRTDGQPYTLWGEELKHANHLDAGERMMATVPNVRASSWYEWAEASRRALSLLEAQLEVDPEKLGAFGVSMGGTLLWTLAATDERIRASCAIYGLGWHTYKEEFRLATGVQPDYTDDAVRIWRGGMEPEVYAPSIRSPMLFVSATNDFYGKMDQAFDILSAFPEQTPRRAAFTPGFNHYIHWEQVGNVAGWMDTWLKGGERWPETPDVSIWRNEAGNLEFAIRPDPSLAQPIIRVEAYCSLGNPHAVSRHWRPLVPTAIGSDWRAPLLCLTGYCGTVYAYANVFYESGICLSSSLVTATLGDAGFGAGAGVGTDADAERRSALIYDGRDDLDGWVTNSPNTDPFPHRYSPITASVSDDGVHGFRPDKMLSPLTYRLGDPAYKGRKGEMLRFRLLSRHAADFTVVMQQRYFPSHTRSYTCSASIKGNGEWQTFTLAAELFRHEESGEALMGWVDVNYLELRMPEKGWPDEAPLFANFEWVSFQPND
ncbi:alpha/beta hydrolase family protein [Cohnella silvisoli]|uniref:Acetylxylan esterase n=1 Tax=Cohnella silvisoli TaxID=2873699 RepID=A0ABV1L2H8_9BACL|nr:acetylxylan esterase [Cohnella silvisoli]MCD9021624.1 acetylxylan esterase [Cohnella silvisoli]